MSIWSLIERSSLGAENTHRSNTTVLLSVYRQPSSNMHTFMAKLVNNGRSGWSGKLLRLKFNQTEYEAQTTNTNGNATWTIPLSPQTNNTLNAYNIVVSFGGDQNKTVSAYLYNPYGTRYAASTTTQYNIGTAPGYIPSANSTSLIIMPQTTTGATTLMNQEQMQKKAQDDGRHAKSYNELKQNEVCR